MQAQCRGNKKLLVFFFSARNYAVEFKVLGWDTAMAVYSTGKIRLLSGQKKSISLRFILSSSWRDPADVKRHSPFPRQTDNQAPKVKFGKWKRSLEEDCWAALATGTPTSIASQRHRGERAACSRNGQASLRPSDCHQHCRDKRKEDRTDGQGKHPHHTQLFASHLLRSFYSELSAACESMW